MDNPKKTHIYEHLRISQKTTVEKKKKNHRGGNTKKTRVYYE